MNDDQLQRVRELLDRYLIDQLKADERDAALRPPRDPDEQVDHEDSIDLVLDDYDEALRYNDLRTARGMSRHSPRPAYGTRKTSQSSPSTRTLTPGSNSRGKC